jgi:CheY-like chemotaxis protein
MPQGLDGDSATLMIHQFHPGMPIVAVTSASRPEDVENYLRRRMDGVLSKPVERGRLLKVLEVSRR